MLADGGRPGRKAVPGIFVTTLVVATGGAFPENHVAATASCGTARAAATAEAGGLDDAPGCDTRWAAAAGAVSTVGRELYSKRLAKPGNGSGLMQEALRRKAHLELRSEGYSPFNPAPPPDLNCKPDPWPRPVDKSFQFGGLHDVVGLDGVLMISLLRRPERFDHFARRLKEVGVWPTKFPASDGYCDPHDILSAGCIHPSDAGAQGTCFEQGPKAGLGCVSRLEQAVANSHRRALVAAQGRHSEWTAIIEEDVVPVQPALWDQAFREAWKKVPPHIKLVRLSWCTFPQPNENGEVKRYDMPPFEDTGDMILINWIGTDGRYQAGGCTGGYIVHKDIIPEMLALFPCCCAVDACYQLDFFDKPVDGGATRGMQIMLNLDARGSTDYALDLTPTHMLQSGILVQDVREHPSIRNGGVLVQTSETVATAGVTAPADASQAAWRGTGGNF